MGGINAFLGVPMIVTQDLIDYIKEIPRPIVIFQAGDAELLLELAQPRTAAHEKLLERLRVILVRAKEIDAAAEAKKDDDALHDDG